MKMCKVILSSAPATISRSVSREWPSRASARGLKSAKGTTAPMAQTSVLGMDPTRSSEAEWGSTQSTSPSFWGSTEGTVPKGPQISRASTTLHDASTCAKLRTGPSRKLRTLSSNVPGRSVQPQPSCGVPAWVPTIHGASFSDRTALTGLKTSCAIASVHLGSLHSRE